MKNMFKLMGVALLAGAMLFTACKKDKEETTPTPETVVNNAVLTFDGAAWFTTTKAMVMEAGQEGTKEFKIFKEGSTLADAKFSTVLAKGTYGFGDNANVWAVCWIDDNDYVERSNNGSIAINELDLEGKTMSGVISAEVKTAAETEYHTLGIVLTNTKWAE